MSGEFGWSEESMNVDSFAYSHNKYGLEIRGEVSETDDDVLVWSVNLFTASGTHLYEISAMEESREVADKVALEWLGDHDELAGFRLNDGIDSPATKRREGTNSRPLGERETAADDLESWGFQVGAVFFFAELDAYLRVTELGPDGFVAKPVDEVKQRTIGVYSTTAWNAAGHAESDSFYRLNQAAVEAPEETVLRFADEQLTEVVDGEMMESYDGVENVSTVADLKAAVDLAKKTEQP
jgi:hypothetical protein